jgi:hypothetical protein
MVLTTDDENHYEVFWLRDLVGEARAELEH